MRIIDSSSPAYVLKCSVRFLPVESIPLALQAARPAKNGHTPVLANALILRARPARHVRARRQVIQIELDISGDEEVQQAVAVVISPCCPCAPTLSSDARFLSGVGKRSVSVIAIQARDTVVADIHVRVSVIVVVAYSNAETPPLIRHSRLVGHIFKAPIAQVAVQRGPGRLFLPLQGLEGGAVDKIHVRSPVAVVIKDRDTA